MPSLHRALSCSNTRDKKLNKGWAFSSRCNKGSVHCCWNQWKNSSHMLSPSFARDGKIPSPPPTYFRTIYERNAVVFQLKQKAGAEPSSFHSQICYNFLQCDPSQMTIYFDFKIILSYNCPHFKFVPHSKCLGLMEQCFWHRLALHRKHRQKLKEWHAHCLRGYSWLNIFQSVHKFTVQIQVGCASQSHGAQDNHHRATQHMASERSCGIYTEGLRGFIHLLL